MGECMPGRPLGEKGFWQADLQGWRIALCWGADSHGGREHTGNGHVEREKGSRKAGTGAREEHLGEKGF
jgi:hypothetical protein